jgi:hypothetical protein
VKRLNFSDGVLLAAVPAAGYIVAYLYELGYCHYFNIPSEFIYIDRQVIVTSVLAVLGFVAALHSLIDFIREHFAWVPRPLGRVLLRIAVALGIVLGLAVVSRATYLQMAGMCAIVVGPTVIGNLLLPLLPSGSSGGYIDRVALELSKGDARRSMLDIYAKFAGASVFLGVGLFYLVCVSAYVVGGYTAKGKVRFLTVRDSSEVVLVRTNSDFLVAPYDSSRGVIQPDVRLIPLDAKLHIADIGPLLPALPGRPANKSRKSK